jgi:hypothetical protein
VRNITTTYLDFFHYHWKQTHTIFWKQSAFIFRWKYKVIMETVLVYISDVSLSKDYMAQLDCPNGLVMWPSITLWQYNPKRANVFGTGILLTGHGNISHLRILGTKVTISTNNYVVLYCYCTAIGPDNNSHNAVVIQSSLQPAVFLLQFKYF